MSMPIKSVEQLLRQWAGEDAAERTTSQELAAEIDREYEQYVNSLRAAAQAIVAGDEERERLAA